MCGGSCRTRSRTTSDETPTIAADLFDPGLRDGLTSFFLRAFHRDVDRRFDTSAQMHNAWRDVFRVADAASPATTHATVGLESIDSLDENRDVHAKAAQLDTPLEAAGLTPRAVSLAHGLSATTVGELLDVPPHHISKARGAGRVIRNELIGRHRQWTAALRRTPTPAQPAPVDTEPAQLIRGQVTVDELVAQLVPTSKAKGAPRPDVVRLTLGLDGGLSSWPNQVEVAKAAKITQASVSRHQQAIAKLWASEHWLVDVRDELVDLVAGAGRVMTTVELVAAVRARHGTGEDDLVN